MNARTVRLLSAGLAGALLAWPALPPQAAASNTVTPTLSLAPLIEAVAPAVVKVTVKGKSGAGGAPASGSIQYTASGSGVIVDAGHGYVMTSAHLVDDGGEISVTLDDQRMFTAKVIGSDQGTDIAVLAIEAKNLAAVPIGDSNTLRVGDFVIALGVPFGARQTATAGIVSALGRSGAESDRYQDFIQTDAAASPGSTGGALIDMKGRLVGINTAAVGVNGAGVRISLAVPMAMAGAVMGQLVRYGEVRRGRIGIEAEDMTPDLAMNLAVTQTTGALVEEVDTNSPAEQSGVKTGDVIIALDGKPVASAAELHNRLGLILAGTTTRLTVLRNGAGWDLVVTLGDSSDAALAGNAVSRVPAGGR